MATRQIGRDAINGRIISVEEAKRRKNTAIVEIINIPTSKRPAKKKNH